MSLACHENGFVKHKQFWTSDLRIRDSRVPTGSEDVRGVEVCKPIRRFCGYGGRKCTHVARNKWFVHTHQSVKDPVSSGMGLWDADTGLRSKE